MRPERAACLGLLCATLAVAPVAALELDARLKGFATVAVLPGHDFQRNIDESPALDTNFDLRLMFRESAGPLEFSADYSVTTVGGDSFAYLSAPGTTLDQTPGGDEGRVLDLSWEIEDGARHRTWHRFDRLSVRYRGGD